MAHNGTFEGNLTIGKTERISEELPEPVFSKPQELLKSLLPLSPQLSAYLTAYTLSTSVIRIKKPARKANEQIRQRGEMSRLQFTDE
ncbi:hypothetical protein LJB77_00025 [Ruminococcaceae bacterium OttesenSCG-928-N02]|nr:hypothetical protein [Ruminococcaceae bacterium OttesenSCG-928-N02]